MLQKLKQLFKKETLPEQYMSGFDYRPNITMVRFEIYKDVPVVYIRKPRQGGLSDPLEDNLEYNCFYKRKFYSDKAISIDTLIQIAHNDIDTNFINKPQ